MEEIKFASVSEETKTKLRELCRPLQVPEGECSLRLNPRVMESFIFNKEKLHENVSANDLYVIKAIDSGDLSSGQLDQLLPVHKDLVIKLGCPVMCVRNTDNQIKNGSRGIVTFFINNFLVVHFQRENRVMYFSPSVRVLWCLNKQGKTGKRLQIPIVAAYAITIHKSQGMAIHYGELNVDRLWEPGQGYTGFSRFTTMEGLRLLNWTGGPLNIVSKDVVRYDNFLRSRPANCTSSLISSATPTELSYCNCMQNDQVGQDKTSKLQTLSSPQPEATIGKLDIPENEQSSDDADSDTDDLYGNDEDNNVSNLEFFKSWPVDGHFWFPVTVTSVECLNELGTNYLSADESERVAEIIFFIQTLYDSDNLFMMFNTFFHFIWKKVSDIIHSACASSSPTDSYNLTKDQAEEMYLKVEGLATQRVIKSRWRFLRDQMHLIRSVKLKKFLSHLLLYSMIKLIYKSIIIPLSVSKSKVLLAQIEKGESFKIDTTSEEGKAVIRHLGGWAIHSVMAELNRYIMLCASSRKQTVQDKVSHCISLRKKLCESLVVSSSEIHEITSFLTTLQHTDYYNRGSLAYISDNCYLFFTDLEQSSEKFLQKFFLLQFGNNFVTKAISKLHDEHALYETFTNLFQSEDSTPSTVVPLATECVSDQSEIIEDFRCIDFDENIDLCDIPNFCDQPSLNFSDVPFSDLSDFSSSCQGSPPASESDVHSTEVRALNDLTKSATSSFLQAYSESASTSDASDCLKSLYGKIVMKFFMCRTKQFIKSLRNEMEIEKAKAHRKRIQQKSEKDALKDSKWSFTQIKTDLSQCKHVSHNIIAGNLAKNPGYFNVYTVPELKVLLKAYNIPFRKTGKKEQYVNILKEKFSSANLHGMECPDVFTASSVPSEEGSVSISGGQKRRHVSEV